MTIALQVIFWLSVLAMFHSYVLYPLIISIVARRRKSNQIRYEEDDELPEVLVMLSAYNEEAVLEEKLDSMLDSDYPKEKLKIYIGSDASTDRTDEILNTYAQRHENITHFLFNHRSGKANILNEVFRKIDSREALNSSSIFIMTDANVMFTSGTVRQLVRHFKNDQIGQVGAHIVNKGMKPTGISNQEKYYISRENKIKNDEGVAWGTMMGAFGACYAIRTELFTTIPSNYLMEDFYLSMHVLSMDRKAIHEMDAICYEDIPDDISIEYKRKRRISAGNFQNLKSYKHLLWPPYKPLGFSFLSHKVLRWFGPFFIGAAYISSGVLAIGNKYYLIMFILQNVLFLVPVLDHLLKKVSIHSIILRFISYFLHMNFALFEGFLNYIKGVQTNVWQPTKRINE